MGSPYFQEVFMLIFATNKHIQVEYANETVNFLKHYSLANRPITEVTVDLLITNKTTNSPIKKLYFIYPRAFFHVSVEENRILPKKPICKIEDITDTLLIKNHPQNEFLSRPPCKLEITDRSKDAHKVVSWQIDPLNPDSLIDYKGSIYDNGEIQEMDLSDEQWLVLMNMGKAFTPFEYTLGAPLKYNEARWLRFHISGVEHHPTWRDWAESFENWLWRISGPDEKRFTLQEWKEHSKNWLLDEVVANSHLVGPLDIKHQFFETLRAYTADPAESEQDTRLKSAGAELIKKFQKLLKGSEINIIDWRINVFPMHNWELENLNYDGDILPAGNLPNFILSDNPYESQIVYQWNIGEKYIPKEKQRRQGMFHINFMVKHPSRFGKTLPWIAFLTSLLALIIAIFS